MAVHLRYTRNTFTPPDTAIPGNSAAKDPVQFDLVPAEGGDLARIKSVVVGAIGLTVDVWSPEVQRTVTAAFSHSAPAFIDTVVAIRGLTIPAAMAVRVKLLETLPVRVPPGGSAPAPDPDAPFAITTGHAYSRICAFLPALSMLLANEIARITEESGIDTRFFASPSGSPAPATPVATPIAASAAPTAPEGPATADSPDPTPPLPDGTTPLVPSS